MARKEQQRVPHGQDALIRLLVAAASCKICRNKARSTGNLLLGGRGDGPSNGVCDGMGSDSATVLTRAGGISGLQPCMAAAPATAK